jgi:PAS domain S-box-containing protein
VPESNFSQESITSDDSGFLLALVGFDLKIKVLNRAWEKLLGYPPELLIGRPLTDLVDKDEQALALMLVNERIAGVSERPIEFTLRCRDASYRCFAWMSTPVPAEQAMFITGRDVTERKKLETTDNLQRYLQAKKTGAI